MKDKSIKKTQFLVLFLIVLILLYLLIQNFGYIENGTMIVPTGNVDIFEIECDCCKEDIKPAIKKDENTKEKYNITKKKKRKKEIKREDTDENKLEEEEEEEIEKEIEVFDDYKIWDNKQLRIFSNTAYEYENKIAPGSKNSYAFVIKNNNDFDIVYDIYFKEVNNKKINMQYKLTHEGNYLIGSATKYVPIANKKVASVELAANEQKAYILHWKWVDSSHDADAGFDINSRYKLSIIVGVI